jgi:hypothetical protein
MIITATHRNAARAMWECGRRIEDAAAKAGVRPCTIRKWLRDPAFQALVAEAEMAPIIQATTAALRWAPAAVARLIEDLKSESAEDARHAARDILRIALDPQKGLDRWKASREADAAACAGAAPPGAMPDDPLSSRIAALSEDQLAKMLEILNGE